VKARWRANSNSGVGRLHGDRGTDAHTGGANDAISSVHDEHVCLGVDAHCVRAGKRGHQRVSSIATVAAVACSKGQVNTDVRKRSYCDTIERASLQRRTISSLWHGHAWPHNGDLVDDGGVDVRGRVDPQSRGTRL